MCRSLADGPASRVMRRRRPKTFPRYRDLPNELKGLIKDYVAFTNASLRAAIAEYFGNQHAGAPPLPSASLPGRGREAIERRHGKMGTWDVSRVKDCADIKV